MKKKIIWLALVVILVILIARAVNAPSSAPASDKPVKIGVLLPLTGGAATSGEKLLQGAKLAAKDLKNVQLIIEDTHSKASDAVTAANKLINVDKVDAILGPYVPEETIAVAPVAKEKGIVLFSASFCSDAYKPLDNVLCGYATADQQLDTVIPEIKKEGIKRMALVNTNDDFGISSQGSMKAKATDAGYKIVLDELVPFGSRDLKSAADKVISSKADAVFIASGDTAQAFTLMKLLYERGFKGMRVTFIDVDTKYLTEFGQSADGTFAPGIAPSRFSEDYAKKFQIEYNVTATDYLPALGYDILRYISGTFENKRDKTVISAALDYDYKDPAIARFKYLPDRTVLFDMELWKAVGGKYIRAN